jgi:hypothetical protein
MKELKLPALYVWDLWEWIDPSHPVQLKEGEFELLRDSLRALYRDMWQLVDGLFSDQWKANVMEVIIRSENDYDWGYSDRDGKDKVVIDKKLIAELDRDLMYQDLLG